VYAVFFSAVCTRISDRSAAAINNSISALFNAFGIRHQSIIGRNCFATTGRCNYFPYAA
jgi:hypothetical protein